MLFAKQCTDQSPAPEHVVSTPIMQPDPGLIVLAEAIRMAVMADRQPISINFPEGMVQVKNDIQPSEVVQAPAPDVTVNIPEQPTPVVNVEVKADNKPDESKDVVKAIRKLAKK